MTENLRDRIAAVLNRHKTDGDRHNEWSDCQCGHVGTRWDDHVADAVIRELGLDEAHQDCRCQLRYLWESQTGHLPTEE